MAQGRRERGKEEGERQGSQNLFLFALGCRRFPSSGAGSRSEEGFSFCPSAGLQSPHFSLLDKTWTAAGEEAEGKKEKRKRRGEEHGAREETTSRGRFFGGERRGALERGSSAVSPTPFSRECLVRVLWGTTVPFAAALFWPFGGGWLRERKAAAWKTRKGKSRSQLEVEKKRGNVTLRVLFSFFTPFVPRSAAAATRNGMLGSAPQLQDAPGVAYLCGDCGELKGGVARKRGDVGDSFFVIARCRPSDASTSLVFFWCPCSSSSSASIVPGARNNDL